MGKYRVNLYLENGAGAFGSGQTEAEARKVAKQALREGFGSGRKVVRETVWAEDEDEARRFVSQEDHS